MPGFYNARFSEEWECLGVLYGNALAAANESNTGYKSLAQMHRAVIIIHPVDVNDNLDVDIEQALDTAGTTPKAFHGGDKDATILTTDTKPTVIEIRSEELDVNGGYIAINVEVTCANTAGGGNDYAVEIWGLPRYTPADTTNLDSVID